MRGLRRPPGIRRRTALYIRPVIIVQPLNSISIMAKKENAGTEAYRPDPNRETILMADKANGRLDVII